MVADALFGFAAVEGFLSKKHSNGESPDDDVADDVSDDLQQVCVYVLYCITCTCTMMFAGRT